MISARGPFLLSFFLVLSVCSRALALDTTYLIFPEPKGWRCAHEAQSWVCLNGEGRNASLLEIKGELLPISSNFTLTTLMEQQRKLGTVTDAFGRVTKEALRSQHRLTMAGLEWSEVMKNNSGRPGMVTHQWATVLPTQHGPFVISATAGYPAAAVATLDPVVGASLRALRLNPHIVDYVEYLSIPESRREGAVPQIVTGTSKGAKVPVCAQTRKLDMTVGAGRLVAYPLRATGVAVIESSRSLEVLATHVPYVMTTLLFSPMSEGNADVYVFDRTQKCRVHYAVGISADRARAVAPREWTTQTIRTPSSAAEADAEYARLATAIRAGHLESGNPVAAVPFPIDGTMWISDPRIFDTVKMKPQKDVITQLTLIGKRPGTTTLVALDTKGRGRGYRVTVDARAMRVESIPMGEYESDL